ncbi:MULTISPECIES: hypothetical protein [Microvirga]|uniref:hypothetical protein n=1 Tax=Microvirga TaxID=186650 RepID=UPI0021C9391F|nr:MULTISPECIES: hypothetical protein [unclassified Microvirga]
MSAAPVAEQEPAPDLTLMEPRDETKQDATEQPPVRATLQSRSSVKQIRKAETVTDPTQVEVEHQPALARGRLIANLVRRKA